MYQSTMIHIEKYVSKTNKHTGPVEVDVQCVQTADAHQIFVSFGSRHLSFEQNKLDCYTNAHTQFLKASTDPDINLFIVFYKKHL